MFKARGHEKDPVKKVKAANIDLSLIPAEIVAESGFIGINGLYEEPTIVSEFKGTRIGVVGDTRLESIGYSIQVNIKEVHNLLRTNNLPTDTTIYFIGPAISGLESRVQTEMEIEELKKEKKPDPNKYLKKLAILRTYHITGQNIDDGLPNYFGMASCLDKSCTCSVYLTDARRLHRLLEELETNTTPEQTVVVSSLLRILIHEVKHQKDYYFRNLLVAGYQAVNTFLPSVVTVAIASALTRNLKKSRLSVLSITAIASWLLFAKRAKNRWHNFKETSARNKEKKVFELIAKKPHLIPGIFRIDIDDDFYSKH